MRKYRYDLHTHEKTVSRCAAISPEQLVLRYLELGYDGIVLTNHFVNGYCNIDRSLPWSEQMDLYCQGYESVKKYGDIHNLKVFFGIEYDRNNAEFLIYGMNKDILKAKEDFATLPIKELGEFVTNNGGVMFQAHPFRDTPWTEKIRLYPKYVSGFEILNAHNHPAINEIAVKFNDIYKLIGTAGSDTHSLSDSKFAGIETDKEITTPEELVEVLKTGNFKIFNFDK